MLTFVFGCSSTSRHNPSSPNKTQFDRAKFTDKDLSRYLLENPRGIIYIFSPRMPLSVLGLEEAHEAAKKQGLSFLAIVDPMEADNSIDSDPRLNNIPILASTELVSRDATQHFPATLLYNDGKLVGRFNPGYEEPVIFASNFKRLVAKKLHSKNLNAEQSFHIKTRTPAGDIKPKVFGFLREIPLPAEPTYFIRVDTDAKKLFMSGDCIVSLESGNCVSTGKTWEPYPVSGFELLTIPGCQNTGGMCFYDTRDYHNQAESTPVFIDPDLKGYYQSVGFLARSENEASIRVITYYGFMRDYIVRKGYVRPRGAIKKFCKGRSLLKLPMLSKDGRYISGWDDDKKKTVIISLSEKGECTEVYSTDEMLSKMDWSYDGKFVAFHVSTNKSGKISEDTPNELIDQQIFIMNLASKKTVQLSFGPELYYFPHFGRNGLLYALKRKPSGKQFSVVELNPALIDIN